ncbi:ABC transporter ATP-binding protein [Saccharospirillum impatiens]|uniref:ABC transporter ATP-binding protein n=1 Tax=Saccharospirillum impatiens TaxID=169438 RepID=UPI0003FC4B27|nr:ABC transporter ATP-binding protein [Saccharospirillum impatiens]
MTTLLSVTGLNVSFPSIRKTVRAVRGVSLSLDEGEIVALVGESGSGKTMTAMATMGLLPDSAEVTGECQWLGRSQSLSPRGNRKSLAGQHAAIIFQNPLTALNPFFTIEQQLTDVALASGKVSRKTVLPVLLDKLSRVQLPDPAQVLKKYPHQLSGGQIQRVVIAMALVCQPRVLIADEPTTALDVIVQAEILQLLQSLAREEGLSVLLITHDLGVVASLCDRVEVMYAGEIIESGQMSDVLRSPAHPYTRKLMATVPDIRGGATVLEYISGQVPDLSRPIRGCAFKERCDRRLPVCDESPPVRALNDGQRYRCHLTSEQEVEFS